jgi:predicted AAA+ superfamily ATPase
VGIIRRMEQIIPPDLDRKLVVLSGPRQCGKTTLAKKLVRERRGAYYSWDIHPDRLKIQRREIDFGVPFWAFDEIHKFARWRAFLKDLTDSSIPKIQALVTGSAKLEFYGRGGDSLQGRYYPHHMHPLTYSEIHGLPLTPFDAVPDLPLKAKGSLSDLLRLGGFPEPFLSGSDAEAARWRMGYAERLTREELVQLERVAELERVELLFDRLRSVAGGIVSVNALREDLQVAFETAAKYLDILERLNAIFRIAPAVSDKLKAVKKERKLYFWDWAYCESEGARYENLIALHLLRFVDMARDVWGKDLSLRYFRHRDGKEVDFVLLLNRRPYMAIEAKLTDSTLSPSLQYYLERVKVPFAFQVVLDPKNERTLAPINGAKVRIVSAARFLANLP